jgi:hypothetical protein
MILLFPDNPLGVSASALLLEALGVVNFHSASAFLYQIDFSNVLLLQPS